MDLGFFRWGIPCDNLLSLLCFSQRAIIDLEVGAWLGEYSLETLHQQCTTRSSVW